MIGFGRKSTRKKTKTHEKHHLTFEELRIWSFLVYHGLALAASGIGYKTITIKLIITTKILCLHGFFYVGVYVLLDSDFFFVGGLFSRLIYINCNVTK